MIAQLLNRLFILITSRPVLVLLGGVIVAAALPMILEQWHFLATYWAQEPTDTVLDEMEDLIDGLAGILVAAGVFFEERGTIRTINNHNIDLHASEAQRHLQEHLNEVAHHNGMGILLLGLFMEIGTLIVRLPERIVTITHTVEKCIFAACFVLSLLALLIMYDFLKDFVKTFFDKRYRTH
jgi:hypothetical protein